MARWKRRSVLALGIAVAVAVLAELTLRVVGHLYLDRLYTNLSGVQAGDISVICLGESSTAGLWVDANDAYPRQLERQLREHYGVERIRVIAPPHIGQNTSQMSNRTRDYLTRYRPKLLILMLGANNEWSLAESHITEFLGGSDWQTRKIKLLVALDNFRLYKVLHYLYLSLVVRGKSLGYVEQNPNRVWGHPGLQPYPPPDWIYSFGLAHQDAVIKLWRRDVRTIIEEAKKAGTRVLLMAYPIQPAYLPVEELVVMARREGIPLVRNDESFRSFLQDAAATDRYLFHDRWHPRAAGYAIVAANALQAIENGDLLGLGSRRAGEDPSRRSQSQK